MALLAHQGGWDELLLTAALVLAILGVSRLRRRAADSTPSPPPAPSSHPPAPSPAPKDVCAYCGAALAPAEVRCSACGFRRGEAAPGPSGPSAGER